MDGRDYGLQINCEENEKKAQEPSINLLRVVLEEAKIRHAKAIKDNHGFSLKYLRRILTPLFIDVPDDPPFPDSLKTLAEARGTFAHRAAVNAEYGEPGHAQKPMTPETAREVVSDCLSLCESIAQRANSRLGLTPVA